MPKIQVFDYQWFMNEKLQKNVRKRTGLVRLRTSSLIEFFCKNKKKIFFKIVENH